MRLTLRVLSVLLLFSVVALGCDEAPTSAVNDSQGDMQSAATTANFNPANCDATVSSGGVIQTAVDNATSGQTVCVEAGTYDENVTVSTANLTLQGPNAGISGSNKGRKDEAVVTDGIKVDANGVTLGGLQVESTTTNGVRLENPVDNTTIQNNVITNVDGGTFGSGDGTRGAGNGVQVQFTADGAVNKTANGLHVLDNKISNITTPDLSSGDDRTLAIGVNVLPRGNDINDLVIDGNVFRDIEPGKAGNGVRRARAISVGTQLDGNRQTGDADGVKITNNDISAIAGSRLFAVSLFEDGSVNPRRGVQDFEIKNNDFNNLNATSNRENEIEAAIFIGGYEELGDNHVVTKNNVNDGFVERFARSQSNFTPKNADALSAECNWWGDRSGPTNPDNPNGEGTVALESGSEAEIDFRPWLVAPSPSNACIGGENPGNGNGPGGTPGGGPGQ